MRLGGTLTNRLVITIDLHLSAPSRQFAQHRRLHEVARKLIDRLAVHQLPATFGLSRPGYGQFAHWISSQPQHETALLLHPSSDWLQWGGQGLIDEIQRLAGRMVRSVFVPGPLSQAQSLALHAAGVSAIRGNGGTRRSWRHQQLSLFEPSIQAPSLLGRLTDWLPQRFDLAKPSQPQVLRICGETAAQSGDWATNQAIRAIDLAAQFRDQGGQVETLYDCAGQADQTASQIA
ncbi:MAG: hypothetical protein ACIALR_16290 [Blastopirellula sp. JB062]